MSWNDLIGQEPAKEYLRLVLTGNRLAHAYLFTGARGAGKEDVARTLALHIHAAMVSRDRRDRGEAP